MRRLFLAVLAGIFLAMCGERAEHPQQADHIDASDAASKSGIIPQNFSTGEAGAVNTPPENRTKVLNGLLSVTIPAGFTIMAEAEKELKYPGKNAPQEVWANKTREVSIGFSNTKEALPAGELKAYVAQISEALNKSVTGIKQHATEFKHINGLDIGMIEFEAPAADTDLYNLMCFTVVDGELIIYTFNCLMHDIETWHNKAVRVIESVSPD